MWWRTLSYVQGPPVASGGESPFVARGITIVALDERCEDCSLRSHLFDSLASELGRYAARPERPEQE